MTSTLDTLATDEQDATMTSELDTSRSSRGDRARSRAYYREFGVAMGAYLVVLVAVTVWGGLHGHSPARFALAVLPAIPAAGVAWAVLRHVRRIDDYQRRILLEGVAMGFALAMLAAITLGLLAAAGLVVPGSAWIIYGIGMVSWAIGSGVASRR
jgi:hypothetical protein